MVKKAPASFEKMRKHKNLMIWLILLAALIPIAGVSLALNLNVPAKPNQPSPLNHVVPESIFREYITDGWDRIENKALGYTIEIPSDWHELDSSKRASFLGQCFGPFPGGMVLNFPQFCIEYDPWVRPDDSGFASNSDEAQELFFNKLIEHVDGETWVVGAYQYRVTPTFEVNDAPAVERVEALALGTEGTEQVYSVSMYINDPSVGLIRLTMRAFHETEFKIYEATMRSILASFSYVRETE